MESPYTGAAARKAGYSWKSAHLFIFIVKRIMNDIFHGEKELYIA